MNKKHKILVVEDDRDTLMGLSFMLTKSGYEVVRAEDGAMAVQIATRVCPDLILLDLGLPAGDGFSIMERLQRDFRLIAVPVIVVSARDAVTNKDRAIQMGAHAYFEKPADMTELLSTIQNLFNTLDSVAIA